MRRTRHVLGLLAVLALSACGGETPATDRATSGATCPAGGTALRYTGGTGPVDFGRTFMTAYCTGCHASDKVGLARQGAPDHANFDSLAIIRDHLALIDQMAAAGPSATNTSMPPAGGPTPGERQQLGEWLACGAPDGP
jgi:uncharacterized membrane protein